MKWYVAYKFKGEEKDKVKEFTKAICDSLQENNQDNYCVMLDDSLSALNEKEIIEHALKKIDEIDGLIVFLNSDEKSEGMLLELGYALGKGKRVVLLVNKKVKETRLRGVIPEVYEFDNIEDLKEAVKNIK